MEKTLQFFLLVSWLDVRVALEKATLEENKLLCDTSLRRWKQIFEKVHYKSYCLEKGLPSSEAKIIKNLRTFLN